MTLIEPLEFRRVHLAILFGCGIVFKGLWKHLTGSHLIVFTVCVGGLYLAKLMKPKDALDEEIEKLDAALTSPDGDDVRTYVRPTKFIVPEAERGLFTYVVHPKLRLDDSCVLVLTGRDSGNIRRFWAAHKLNGVNSFERNPK
ncbi:hypothetical protein AaE_010953 [Aphanomyces astaci]|uniref:Uncharacterized protein n=1 Tax=Aphanomyces astaci TaxID=112090 RepID=A0A6A4ZVC4_APHAT|nr:hypothetical protein AaE_010953 [Aphanomyces astaci]